MVLEEPDVVRLEMAIGTYEENEKEEIFFLPYTKKVYEVDRTSPKAISLNNSGMKDEIIYACGVLFRSCVDDLDCKRRLGELGGVLDDEASS